MVGEVSKATTKQNQEEVVLSFKYVSRWGRQMLQIYQRLRMPPLEELLLLNWPDVHLSSSPVLALWGNLLTDFISSLLLLLNRIGPSKMTPVKTTCLHKFDDLSSILERLSWEESPECCPLTSIWVLWHTYTCRHFTTHITHTNTCHATFQNPSDSVSHLLYCPLHSGLLCLPLTPDTCS